MKPSQLLVCKRASLSFFVVLLISAASLAQGLDSVERGRMKDILKIVHNDVKNNYYDPGFHGIDLEQRFQKAEERLKDVKSTPEALGIIAQVMLDFNDSHLFLVPPS